MQPIPTDTEVLSASPEELTQMLFDGAVRFAREARIAEAAGDHGTAARQVLRVEAIIEELRRTLDPAAGELSVNLGRIYDYLLERLESAPGEAGALPEVIAHLETLADTWREVSPAGAQTVGAAR